MTHFYAAVFVASLSPLVMAAPPNVGDWRKANERVEQAGGWKAYARELEPAERSSATESPSNPTAFSLRQALDRALSLDPGLRQILAGTTRDPKAYLTLTDHQRAALTREAQLVGDISSLYYAAVAAQERLGYQIQVAEVASIAAELATRMRQVGNLNMLHQAEEQLSFAQSEKDLSQARLQASITREALIKRLQISGSLASDLILPARLPELPALQSSVDTLSATDSILLATVSSNPAIVLTQSEARQAIAARHEAHALVKQYRHEILPLARRISEEHLLHYNGMIIGIFDLLKDAKNQIRAVEGYLNAQLTFWQAESALNPKLFALREQLSQFRRDAWK